MREHFFKILLGVTVLAVVSLFRGDYSLTEYLRMRSRIQQSEEHIHELESQRKTLEEQRDLLEKDEAYIEKQAREKYKMTKKGEKVIRVVRQNGGGND